MAVKFAIEHLDSEELHAATSAENVASQKVLEKSGFRLTGIAQEDSLGVMKGDYQYAISAADLNKEVGE